MKYNREIEVTKHAAERFLQRFGGKTGLPFEDQLRTASRVIKDAFATARYISDELPSKEKPGGVLFRNDDYRMDIIVRQCRITTVINQKRDHDEGRANESQTGKTNDYHGPSQTAPSATRKAQKEAKSWK